MKVIQKCECFLPLVQALVSGLVPAVLQQLLGLELLKNQSYWSALLGQVVQSRGLADLPSVPLVYHWTPTRKHHCGIAGTISKEKKQRSKGLQAQQIKNTWENVITIPKVLKQ